jgi:hypothetical protein
LSDENIGNASSADHAAGGRVCEVHATVTRGAKPRIGRFFGGARAGYSVSREHRG